MVTSSGNEIPILDLSSLKTKPLFNYYGIYFIASYQNLIAGLSN